MADNTRDLTGVLRRRARDAADGTKRSEFRARALEAAFAQGQRSRAWSRVRIAADLRADGEFDAALHVLDAAWVLDPPEDAERAIFTVAIATHCDLGAQLTAEVLEREQAARSVDLAFARAAARLYAELTRATADAAHRSRRDHYVALIGELEAHAVAA